MTQAMIAGVLQDMIDLTNEIDWRDKNLPDIFEYDLSKKIGDLAKVLYSIHGYQTWNGKEES